MPVLSRVELSDFLPHGEEMCLINSVKHWDATSITCHTSTHRHHDNPLLHQGRLEILTGLEYSAQAMGIHVGLTRGTSSDHGAIGYLGGVRDLQLYSQSFHQFSQNLTIEASLIMDQHMSFIYAFTMKIDERPLLEGRASIFIQGTKTIP